MCLEAGQASPQPRNTLPGTVKIEHRLLPASKLVDKTRDHGRQALKECGAKAQVLIHHGSFSPTHEPIQTSSEKERSAAFPCIDTQRERPVHADPEDIVLGPRFGRFDKGVSIFGMVCLVVLPNICRTQF